MKLISMTSFVLEIEKSSYTQTEKYRIIEWENKCQAFDKIINYAKFVKQPLKLEMFVPCDEEGDILEEPTDYELRLPNMMTEYNDEVYRYKQAKEKVLFEGIEFRTNGGVNFLTIKEDTFAFHDFNIKFKNLTVEFLVQYNLQLTESAIKQIGL